MLLIDLLCLLFFLFSGTENATEGAPAVATGELLLIYNTSVHETERGFTLCLLNLLLQLKAFSVSYIYSFSHTPAWGNL